VAVLGSMLELGGVSKKGHKVVGRHLARRKISYLNTYGKGAEQIGKGAVESGFSPKKVRHFIYRRKLNRHIYRLIRPQTTILVKGSHDLRMNRTVAFLRKKLGET
ncbi:MAG: UDP-N-acetylmuramoyl-tripeptide--D-alanyl-D-alanine ligase, partial [Ignavibacteriales bacterium]